jgi:hypothetical protein
MWMSVIGRYRNRIAKSQAASGGHSAHQLPSSRKRRKAACDFAIRFRITRPAREAP